MLHLPYTLAEIDAWVHETTRDSRVWSFSDPYLGARVDAERRRLDEVTISFYFVMPHPGSQDEVWPLLTLARGVSGEPGRMPRFWDPVLLRDFCGGCTPT